MKKTMQDDLVRRIRYAGPCENPTLSVAVGMHRPSIASLEEAARVWCEFRDASGEGVSTIGDGIKVYRQDGILAGHISYNGRIWPHTTTPKRKENAMKTRKTDNPMVHTPKTAKALKAEKPAPETVKPLPKVVVKDGHATVQDAAVEATPVATEAAAPEVVTTASKKAAKKEKAPREPKAPKEDLMTFAFRLSKNESEAIHKAAGAGKASKFARTLLVAAARRDNAAIAEILKSVAAAS